jgi:hypothetical protein
LRVCEGCEVESVVRTKWRGVGLGPRDKRRKLNHKNTIKGENTFPPFAVAWPVSVRNDRESSSEQGNLNGFAQYEFMRVRTRLLVRQGEIGI